MMRLAEISVAAALTRKSERRSKPPPKNKEKGGI
jgi:hypothetical protein